MASRTVTDGPGSVPAAQRAPRARDADGRYTVKAGDSLRLIASRDGDDGSVSLRQDVRVFAGLFDGAESSGYQLAGGRRAWLQMARGELSVGDTRLKAGDGARTAGPAQLGVHDGADAEVLLFDLP